MIECNDLYDYGYYIYQNSNYFKFSIDSILLAEFINLKDNITVLDMCTGNAPIPMILTSKNRNIKITAIEIQEEVYKLAKQSIDVNNLTNIELINDNIKNYDFQNKHDIVICNPPYFKVNENSELNSNEVKRIARHEVTISLEEVIECGYNHLKDNGSFYLVHRAERLLDVINHLERKNLGIRRIAFIMTGKNNRCELFLIEASKYKKSDPKITAINVNNLKTYKNIFEEV